jgi:hypothetical protein
METNIKMDLNKQNKIICTGFNKPKIGSSGGFL